MKNEIKKVMLVVTACLVAFTYLGAQTPIANLNFTITSATTSLPSNYIYSSTNSPALATQNSIKCIQVTTGGQSTAPNLSSTPAASDGKRWMAFCPDVNCSVTIGIMSNKKVFQIYSSSGVFASYTNTANKVEEKTFTGLEAGKWYAFGGTSSQVYITKVEFTATGPAPKSKDATLSDLKVDGVTIDGFAASKTSYDYSVAATATTAPVVSATKNDTKAADPVITQAALPTAGNPTQATVKVTAEDEETTMTYTITFTRAELSHDATLKEIKVDGVPVSGFSPATETYNISVPYSQTAMPVVTATANNSGAKPLQITQATEVPGSASITVTAEDGSTTKTYTLNFSRAAASSDATLKALTYNGTSVPNFSASKTEYNVDLPEGSDIPVVAAETTHPFANAEIEQPTSTNGTATILVTAEDNHATKQYTITFTELEGPPVPPTTLSLHEPGVYEARSGEGGYAGKLVENGGREYEVFYAGRWDDGGTKLTIHVDPADKSHGITKNETNTSYDAQDGWFKGSGGDKGTGFAAKEEFSKSTERCHTISSSNSVEMHIKGYDQFSLYGADKKWTPDKPSDCKYFKVFIDNVEQTMDQSTDQTIRRFNITTGEHVIKISHSGGEQSLFGGFSLRVAQVPRTQYLIGNDSVQTLLIGNPLANIYYYTKYNSFGETKLVWNGTSVEDINLQVVGSGPIGDTLKLSGNANCPAGDYNYSVVAYKNGTETNRVNGKFKVISDIRALTDTIIEAYKDAEIEPIRFRCYVYQQSEINFAWTSTTPAGLNGSFENGVFTIKGTPAAEGTYTFTISVGTKTYHGEIHIKTLDLSGTPIMYLYKNTLSYEQDGVYNYLIGKGQKLVTWKTSESFSPEKFDARYKLIIISEDVDASNLEVLNVIAGNTNIPVLNLQSYAYQKGRADMGNPYYGSVSNDGVNIYLQHPEHPIFSQFSGKHIGDRIQVLSKVERDGFLPVDVYKQNTLCLATAYTRSRDNYNENGERQTVLHEIPAADRNGKKYICFPLAKEAGENLTPDGKKLLDAIVDYLMNGTAVEAAPYIPEIKLNSLTIANKTASINHDNGTATITLKEEEYIALDSLRAVEPQYTVSDQTLTHVNINAQPSEDGKYDFRFTNILPVTFVVTDYINRKAYNFSLIIQKTQQGLDEVYNVGEWVNIFDIHGRKVATTNENIYQMDLPRGIYIIVTENGNTIKLSR